MDLTEILKGVGLSDEQVEDVNKKMSENKVYLTGEENADERLTKFKEQRDEAVSAKEALEKERDELVTGKDELATQIKDLETKNTELESKTNVDEETQKQLEDLQKQLEDANNKNTTYLKQSTIESKLREAGVTDVDYAAYKLFGKDLSTVEIGEDNAIEGFEDKIAKLQEDKPNLFAKSDVIGQGGLQGDKKPNNTDPFSAIAEKYSK